MAGNAAEELEVLGWTTAYADASYSVLVGDLAGRDFLVALVRAAGPVVWVAVPASAGDILEAAGTLLRFPGEVRLSYVRDRERPALARCAIGFLELSTEAAMGFDEFDPAAPPADVVGVCHRDCRAVPYSADLAAAFEAAGLDPVDGEPYDLDNAIIVDNPLEPADEPAAAPPVAAPAPPNDPAPAPA